MPEKEFIVRKIENGTVIDHIAAGNGLKVAKILGLDSSGNCYVVLANVPSRKLGRKDIVKIEDKELTKKEIEKVSLVTQNATINIIRNSEVAEKRQIEIPEIFEGIMRCPNTNCITNHENAATRFSVEIKHPPKIRCYYCERVFGPDEIDF